MLWGAAPGLCRRWLLAGEACPSQDPAPAGGPQLQGAACHSSGAGPAHIWPASEAPWGRAGPLAGRLRSVHIPPGAGAAVLAPGTKGLH